MADEDPFAGLFELALWVVANGATKKLPDGTSLVYVPFFTNSADLAGFLAKLGARADRLDPIKIEGRSDLAAVLDRLGAEGFDLAIFDPETDHARNCPIALLSQALRSSGQG